MTRLRKKLGVVPLLAFLVVALVGGAAFAQRQLNSSGGGRPEVKVVLDGSVERAGQRLSLDKVENVKPGEILDWQIVSSNEGSAAAHDYKAVGHIPPGTAFVSGSAATEQGSTVIRYRGLRPGRRHAPRTNRRFRGRGRPSSLSKSARFCPPF